VLPLHHSPMDYPAQSIAYRIIRANRLRRDFANHRARAAPFYSFAAGLGKRGRKGVFGDLSRLWALVCAVVGTPAGHALIRENEFRSRHAHTPMIAITRRRPFSKSMLRTLPENKAALDPAAHAHANVHVVPIQTALKSFDKRIVSRLPQRNLPQLARSRAACNAWDAKQ
jgi:hypothetical protein